MIKSNVAKFILAIPLFFIVSCNAAQSSSQIIFKCNTDEPTPIELVVSKVGNKLHLDKFIINAATVIDSADFKALEKSSYHRSLVTEHSLTFNGGESEVIVSDYYSEEFDTVTKENTVTLQKNEIKKYWVCDSTAISKLASIEDF
ncbi:hypothetical protein [Pseudoalteromonas sp. Xi13]|uniref:hypothetical protein n=1 Tax=Pseudoalteromonas sp. Xi13 TaxID=2490635 RepID=UPI000F758ECD|nr:hypothetical protein [Pseudoalteromonas sp. Xi13]AZN34768.1 hypothetical protein EJ103_18925 [Pseudoalteromonas sp. Xi13]